MAEGREEIGRSGRQGFDTTSDPPEVIDFAQAIPDAEVARQWLRAAIPVYPSAGAVEITWTQQDPQFAEPWIFLAHSRQLVKLTFSKAYYYKYDQPPYTVTEPDPDAPDKDAPIHFQVTSVPSIPYQQWALAKELPRGSEPANPYADVLQFDPGELIFISGKPDPGHHDPHPEPTLRTIRLHLNPDLVKDDAYGKDHDTEMWVYLLYNGEKIGASYFETNNWLTGGVFPIGNNYPQGYAPGDDAPVDMRVYGDILKSSLQNADINILWRPRSNDTWITNVYLEATFSDGTSVKTKKVNYTLGNSENTNPGIRHRIAW